MKLHQVDDVASQRTLRQQIRLLHCLPQGEVGTTQNHVLLLCPMEGQTPGIWATPAPSRRCSEHLPRGFSPPGSCYNVTETQCSDISNWLLDSPMVENTVLPYILDETTSMFTLSCSKSYGIAWATFWHRWLWCFSYLSRSGSLIVFLVSCNYIPFCSEEHNV